MPATDYDLNDPIQLAQACTEALLADDPLTQKLGMQIEQVTPGSAELSMQVQDWMCNGHQTCHGGMLFSLADSAFAFACNSDNQRTVAADCHIDYLAPAHQGDRLLAVARRKFQRGRSGICDVRIENKDGELIALFRARAHRLSEPVISNEASSSGADHV